MLGKIKEKLGNFSAERMMSSPWMAFAIANNRFQDPYAAFMGAKQAQRQQQYETQQRQARGEATDAMLGQLPDTSPYRHALGGDVAMQDEAVKGMLGSGDTAPIKNKRHRDKLVQAVYAAQATGNPAAIEQAQGELAAFDNYVRSGWLADTGGSIIPMNQPQAVGATGYVGQPQGAPQGQPPANRPMPGPQPQQQPSSMLGPQAQPRLPQNPTQAPAIPMAGSAGMPQPGNRPAPISPIGAIPKTLAPNQTPQHAYNTARQGALGAESSPGGQQALSGQDHYNAGRQQALGDESTPGGQMNLQNQLDARIEAATNRALAKQEGEDMIKLIDTLATHPGLKAATGGSSVLNAVAIPGSPRKNFLVMEDQIKGKAFLAAYQKLKGGGPITDREGQAATEAQARLASAQSEQEYVIALMELRQMLVTAKQIGDQIRQQMLGNTPTTPQGQPGGMLGGQHPGQNIYNQVKAQ